MVMIAVMVPIAILTEKRLWGEGGGVEEGGEVGLEGTLQQDMRAAARQIDEQTDRRDRQTPRQTDGQRVIQTCVQTDRQTHGLDRQTEGVAHIQVGLVHALLCSVQTDQHHMLMLSRKVLQQLLGTNAVHKAHHVLEDAQLLIHVLHLLLGGSC